MTGTPDKSDRIPERRKVLGDHQRIGKRFVPPFLYQVGPLSEVSWINEIMPELIWLGSLIDEHDYRRGIALGLQLSKAAKSAYHSEKCESFAWISDYARLSEAQRQLVIEKLKATSALSDIKTGLGSLLALYPDCPLRFLADDRIPSTKYDLDRMKSVVERLYARRDLFATWVQSTAVYYVFVAGCLKAVKGTSLANFPEIEKYPSTEESKRVASSVRATVNLLYGEHNNRVPSSWPSTFWNRGLVLESCRGISEVREEHNGRAD
jgi:hypothetical protein